MPSLASSILAMEIDKKETKNFHIQTADKKIKIDSEALRRLQTYDIFKKAKGSGKQDDPKILNTIKSFQLDLLEQIKTIHIETPDKQRFELPVLSSLFHMSETLERMLTTGMKERADVIAGKYLVLGDISSVQLKLIIGSIENIANLPKYFSDKNIKTIYSLLEAASFFDIEDIVPDVVMRLSQLPGHFNQFLDSKKYPVFSDALYLYGSGIKDKLFNNIALKLYRKMGYTKVKQITKNIKKFYNDNPMLNKNINVAKVAFSQSGKIFASIFKGGTTKLWDVETGAIIKTLVIHHNSNKSIHTLCFPLAFNPDLTILASGHCLKNIIELWNVKTGALTKTFKGHKDQVTSVAFSSDGKRLASGSCDQTVKVWDVETCEIIKTLEGLKSWIKAWKPDKPWVNSVAFSPDGTTLALGSKDGTIKLWNIKSNHISTIRTYLPSRTFIGTVNFNPDGTMLAASSPHEIILLDVESCEKISVCRLPDGDYVTSVAFCPDGKTFASGGFFGLILKWKLQEIKELKDKTSVPCLLLLQSILHACDHEDRLINLRSFTKLYEEFEKFQPNEKEIVEYFSRFLLCNSINYA